MRNAQNQAAPIAPAQVVDPNAKPTEQPFPGDNPNGALTNPAATALATTADTDFGDDAGAGLEGVTAQEQMTPFVALLQALSPQCIRGKPEYNADARPGMMLNTATQALYDGDEGVEIIPVYREALYSIWLPRDDGGGFRGTLPADDPLIARLRAEQGQFKPLEWRNAEDENVHLIQQFNLGVLYGAPSLSQSEMHRALIAFTSTKIGIYRMWISRVLEIRYADAAGNPRQPPLFAHRWRLRTVPQSNKKGDFFNFELRLAVENEPAIASLVRRSDPMYAAAKEFYDQWAAGAVKVDYAHTSTLLCTVFTRVCPLHIATRGKHQHGFFVWNQVFVRNFVGKSFMKYSNADFFRKKFFLRDKCIGFG